MGPPALLPTSTMSAVGRREWTYSHAALTSSTSAPYPSHVMRPAERPTPRWLNVSAPKPAPASSAASPRVLPSLPPKMDHGCTNTKAVVTSTPSSGANSMPSSAGEVAVAAMAHGVRGMPARGGRAQAG